MSMTTELEAIKELRRLAGAATPGTWKSIHHAVVLDDDESVNICRVGNTLGKYEPENENRDFIAAANPTTILALLDHIDALAALVEQQRAALEKVSEAWASFERYGEECTFEGGAMISASVLEGLQESAAAALALTPPDALRLHDAEVLERAANSIHNEINSVWPTSLQAGGSFAVNEIFGIAAHLRAGAEGEG